MSEDVQVRTLEGHHDRRAATHWRHDGERYRCAPGVARRRERHGLVEIIDEEEQIDAEPDPGEGDRPEVEIIGTAPEPELSLIEAD